MTDILPKLRDLAKVMELHTGTRPRIATLASDVYDELCAEIIESREFHQIPIDRRFPFRVGGFLVSEDPEAPPGHAYFLPDTP